jgi:hypothetical protein
VGRSQGYKKKYHMSNSDQTRPLGDQETDQINLAVSEGLTPAVFLPSLAPLQHLAQGWASKASGSRRQNRTGGIPT